MSLLVFAKTNYFQISKSEVQIKDMENLSLFLENIIIPLFQIAWLPEVFEIYSMTVLKPSDTKKFTKHHFSPQTSKDSTQKNPIFL